MTHLWVRDLLGVVDGCTTGFVGHLHRGKGHVAVHETGVHGGPPPKLVGAITIFAFVFGSAVLIADSIG